MAIHNQCLLLLLCLLNQREISTLKTRCDSTYPAFVVCSLLPAQGGNRVSSSEAYLGKNTDFSSLRNSTLLSQLLSDEGAVREGTEESAKPLCFSRVRGTSAVRNAVRCTERFWLHRIWSFLPSFSVTSNLSYVICSNLTTLHGQIRNQVTNREPLCFIRQLLCLFLDSCLCVAQMPFVYFRDTCFQDNARPLQQ